MKERIKGAFTKKKIFHFLKMALFVVALSLILLSLLGTVAHATGLVDDTINAENLYSKYPLSNYQLDFYVDNSWSWLPWNWLDGIGKSVQYGLYCITNFVWTISLYLSNATGYVVQEAYKLDFINDMADSIGQSIQTLAGVTQNGFSSTGFYVGFLLLIILVVGLYVAYTGLIKRESVIKERPLSSGASDRKATQSVQPVHRQNVEKVVSQETRQNYKAERTTKAQTFEQSKRTTEHTEKNRSLVMKKGQKKK